LSGLLPPSPAPPGSGCPQLQRPAATGRRRRSLTSTRSHSASRRTVIIWHLLSDPEARYTDLGYGYHQARTDTSRKLRNHIRQIQALGFDVTITQAA
jgi:hypothetical protein